MKRFASAFGVAAIAIAAATSSIDTTPPPASGDAGGFAAAGFRAYIDSITGEFHDPVPPPEIPLSEDLLNAISTDSDGLVEEPGAGEDGGTMVRLNGRFRNIWVGHAGADGLTAAECVSGEGASVATEEGGEER